MIHKLVLVAHKLVLVIHKLVQQLSKLILEIPKMVMILPKMVPEVSKVVCSKPKTSDEVSRQVSTSIEVSKEDTEVCLNGCLCNSYQGCMYCRSNQLRVKRNIPVVEELVLHEVSRNIDHETSMSVGTKGTQKS